MDRENVMEFPRPENIEFCTEATIGPMLRELDSIAGRSRVRYERVLIGRSRAGREMWGLDIGGCGAGGDDDDGERRVSVTAGAHADEPVGPITAFALARFLLGAEAGNSIAATHRFFICPQVNPDGAEANKAWFADPPDAMTYFLNVIREAPGDDVEFGYPDPRASGKIGALRPENQAVADFLAGGGGTGSYAFHASLHSMGIAEGAWFLIGAQWAERTAPLRERLKALAREIAPYPHDIDRQGQKGFTRIERGFATTPTSTAMREFFAARGEDSTAEKFHLSSMEFVQGLGGDPLVMVSELPIFQIGMDYEWSDPPADDTPFLRLRSELADARMDSDPRQAVEKLIAKYALEAVPLATQVRVQGQMILEALEFLAGQERP